VIATGILYALLSGACNGLFTVPMKLIRGWKWENIWLIFILTACWAMPAALVLTTVGDFRPVLAAAPSIAVVAALAFGFAWGFGAILFGLSVDRLGVSLANTLVLGLSSALGSLVPLLLAGTLRLEARQLALFGGVAVFIAGIRLCGSAGRMRDAMEAARSAAGGLSAGLAVESGGRAAGC
jgi:L-rhamnose-H+ transport protein